MAVASAPLQEILRLLQVAEGERGIGRATAGARTLVEKGLRLLQVAEGERGMPRGVAMA